jgi:inhibitor of KinA sporulation pathway (predicted exonuclease)
MNDSKNPMTFKNDAKKATVIIKGDSASIPDCRIPAYDSINSDIVGIAQKSVRLQEDINSVLEKSRTFLKKSDPSLVTPDDCDENWDDQSSDIADCMVRLYNLQNAFIQYLGIPFSDYHPEQEG